MQYSLMKSVLLLCSVLTLALAGLENTAKFGDTILKYYDNQHDLVIPFAASVSCSQKGGELVMPKHKNLNDAVAQVSYGRRVSIGGGDMFGEGSYEWNDGHRQEWSNWFTGEPNDYQGQEDCMMMNAGDKGKWNDIPCCHRLGYVCQIPSDRSVPYENSEFTIYTGNNASSYFQAKKFCGKRRSRLASLKNGDDFKSLLAKLNITAVMRFWIDNMEAGYSCSSVSHNGVSSIDNCLQPMPFICEEVAPLDLYISEDQVKVEPGVDLSVDCSASGVPIPKVTWYRDDIYVRHQERDVGRSTLVLKDISSEDFGMYVCKATNKVGGKPRHMEGYSFIVGSERQN